MKRAQISIDILLFSLASAFAFVSFLSIVLSQAEGISRDFDFFRIFSRASIEGDRILLDPERGLASIEFKRPADHLLKDLPKSPFLFDAETGQVLQEGGTFQGYCPYRAGNYNGRLVVFSVCGLSLDP